MSDGWTRCTTDGWFTAQCNWCGHWFMLPYGRDMEIVERAGFLGLAHHIKVTHTQSDEPRIARLPLAEHAYTTP